MPYPPSEQIGILAQDDHLVWVDKPSGLLSVRGLGPENHDCVVSRLAEQFEWVREVHRLDRDTSGVMVLALDATTHRELCRQFRERETDKAYEAIVAGSVTDSQGRINVPIRTDIDNRPRQIVDEVHGKPSVTQYQVVGYGEATDDLDTTRLRLTPLTGRSHQLRVHLASIGHPILGDDLYAPPGVCKASRRLLLHASWLEVTHPTTGQRQRLESPCPF